MKPETPSQPRHARPDDEAELRRAIDAAERDALLSPEAFLRWLEGHGEESEQPD